MRGRLKLNVDMACGPNKHGSGVGAVIRSANSDLVAAQVLFCQGCGPVEHFYVMNLTIFPFGVFYAECIVLFALSNIVGLSFVSRECNRVAHSLAQHALSSCCCGEFPI
ncbi:hypothetical protein E5676_scaffold775G00140 [Cucumis melo var. makuwa]|nr:hypothetical protein E5676_scaffold775G00140 [Cucumis melo var. makuwa]